MNHEQKNSCVRFARPGFFRTPGQRASCGRLLKAILEEGDPALLAAALGDIARARGMSEIAQASGLTREAL